MRLCVFSFPSPCGILLYLDLYTYYVCSIDLGESNKEHKTPSQSTIVEFSVNLTSLEFPDMVSTSRNTPHLFSDTWNRAPPPNAGSIKK